MPRIQYRPDIRLTDDKLEVIKMANRICEEYREQGYDLTLRQLYYLFVARGHLPNTLRHYKWLGSVINDGRLAGLIDWYHIVDRTRFLRSLPTWRTAADIIADAARDFRIDMWRNQPNRVEVWIEKDALVGIIAGICNRNLVSYFSCRGYTSQSEMWEAAQRIGRYLRTGQNVTILHLGDHDPSGVDMSRDIEDRLNMFIRKDNAQAGAKMCFQKWKDLGILERPPPGSPERVGVETAVGDIMQGWGRLTVRRIALTMPQVRELNPPPNPAKLSDSRAKKYIERYGRESWELDALPPDVLAALIQSNIDALRDPTIWTADSHVMAGHRKMLKKASTGWDGVVEHLESE